MELIFGVTRMKSHERSEYAIIISIIALLAKIAFSACIDNNNVNIGGNGVNEMFVAVCAPFELIFGVPQFKLHEVFKSLLKIAIITILMKIGNSSMYQYTHVNIDIPLALWRK